MYQTLSLSTLTLEVKLIVRDCSRNTRENGAVVVLGLYLKRTEGRSEGVKQAGLISGDSGGNLMMQISRELSDVCYLTALSWAGVSWAPCRLCRSSICLPNLEPSLRSVY